MKIYLTALLLLAGCAATTATITPVEVGGKPAYAITYKSGVNKTAEVVKLTINGGSLKVSIDATGVSASAPDAAQSVGVQAVSNAVSTTATAIIKTEEKLP